MKCIILIVLDYVSAKVWSSKNPGKVAKASSFDKKSEGKISSVLLRKPSLSSTARQGTNNMLCTFTFMTVMLFPSVRFLRDIILKIFLA